MHLANHARFPASKGTETFKLLFTQEIVSLPCSQSSYYYPFAMCNIPFIADMSCRSRLATLNEKLTTLERRVEYIEARVSLSEKSLNFVPD